MPLKKRTESQGVFLQIKNFCLWQEIKNPAPDSETISVTNPKTKETLTKHGYAFDTVEGHVVDIVKYEREHDGTRYVGFKMHMWDGENRFILDMPYQGIFFRRFLKACPNMRWNMPLTIKVFKGKPDGKKDPETAVWWQQNGETVKNYFTKDTPNGMPQATQDPVTHEWDFKEQHRWLVTRMLEITVRDIKEAAVRILPAVTAPRTDEPIDESPEHNDDGVSFDDLPQESDTRPIPVELKPAFDRLAMNDTGVVKVAYDFLKSELSSEAFKGEGLKAFETLTGDLRAQYPKGTRIPNREMQKNWLDLWAATVNLRSRHTEASNVITDDDIPF